MFMVFEALGFDRMFSDRLSRGQVIDHQGKGEPVVCGIRQRGR
jgi:hypothetical protein